MPDLSAALGLVSGDECSYVCEVSPGHHMCTRRGRRDCDHDNLGTVSQILPGGHAPPAAHKLPWVTVPLFATLRWSVPRPSRCGRKPPDPYLIIRGPQDADGLTLRGVDWGLLAILLRISSDQPHHLASADRQYWCRQFNRYDAKRLRLERQVWTLAGMIYKSRSPGGWVSA